MKAAPDYDKWTSVDAASFWCEIAQGDHVIQLYENDGIFLDTLVGFVEATINCKENAVVIATDRHLNAVEGRLQSYGVDIEKMISENRFIPINVEEITSEFMIDDQLDESLLIKAATELLAKAALGNRKFKVFGEIAPTLIANGHDDVALRVEQLFDQIIHTSNSCLYCGYSQHLFAGDLAKHTRPICNVHSKIISGAVKQLTHVVYQDIPPGYLN